MQPRQNFCVDHVMPRARGGADTLENLVPCCSSCNERKGTKTVEEFRRVISSTTTHYIFYFEQVGYMASDEAE
jgi:5-methylcytosine-specific restriction endonuclease McrA